MFINSYVPIFSAPLLFEKEFLEVNARPQNIIRTIRHLTKSLFHSKVISNITKLSLIQ